MSKRHDEEEENEGDCDELNFNFDIVGIDTVSLANGGSNNKYSSNFVRKSDSDSFDFHSGKTPKITNGLGAGGAGNKRNLLPLLPSGGGGSWRITPLGFVVLVLGLILIIRVTASSISPSVSAINVSTTTTKDKSVPTTAADALVVDEELEEVEHDSLSSSSSAAAAEPMNAKPLRETATITQHQSRLPLPSGTTRKTNTVADETTTTTTSPTKMEATNISNRRRNQVRGESEEDTLLFNGNNKSSNKGSWKSVLFPPG